jgi:hypothetical protein
MLKTRLTPRAVLARLTARSRAVAVGASPDSVTMPFATAASIRASRSAPEPAMSCCTSASSESSPGTAGAPGSAETATSSAAAVGAGEGAG